MSRALAGAGPAPRWAALAALSFALAWALQAARLPAATLIGPMLAAIALAASGGGLRLPNWPLAAAQGVIGCMIARALSLEVLREALKSWPLFLATALAVVAASMAMGWLLARWRVLPGTAAIWGSSPGGATAMALMAADYGADVRLVATMQYMRVVLVAMAASGVATLWKLPGAAVAAEPDWFPAAHWGGLAQTLGLVALCAFAVHASRMRALAMLLPIFAATALSGAGLMRIELPPWLLAGCFVFVGWNVGLRFTRPSLAHAAGALPAIAASIVALMAFSAALAFALARFAGLDALTAYLAASPGGLDTVAIIAANAPNVDAPFVMAMQLARFVVVLLVGPAIAKAVARRL